MKYINKYIKMFENEVLERPVVKEQTKTATEKSFNFNFIILNYFWK